MNVKAFLPLNNDSKSKKYIGAFLFLLLSIVKHVFTDEPGDSNEPEDEEGDTPEELENPEVNDREVTDSSENDAMASIGADSSEDNVGQDFGASLNMDDSNEAGSVSKENYEEAEGGNSNSGVADSNAQDEESEEGNHIGHRQRETLLRKV